MASLPQETLAYAATRFCLGAAAGNFTFCTFLPIKNLLCIHLGYYIFTLMKPNSKCVNLPKNAVFIQTIVTSQYSTGCSMVCFGQFSAMQHGIQNGQIYLVSCQHPVLNRRCVTGGNSPGSRIYDFCFHSFQTPFHNGCK